ncbi:MAG: hypothetical protein ACUVX9_04450 [Anaerolineae bacterium]
MRIGKIVRSSSHIDYVCQVYRPGETKDPPRPEDHAFGSFVRIATGRISAIVGVIYNTVLMNPDFGVLGPRLSTSAELAVFSPDYLNEQATLIGIIAIGTLGPGPIAIHGVPPQTAQIDDLVEPMGADEIIAFHSHAGNGVRLGYAPLLIAHGSPLARHLLLNLIERLESLCPQAGPPLQVLKANVAWRAAVEPLG